MRERITFIFENYPLYVVTSKAQRAIKYEFSKSKLIKKFLKKNVFQFKEGQFYIYKDINGDRLTQDNILNNNYTWQTKKVNKIERLFLQTKDDELVIANLSKAGTEKTKIITGQNLHQLTMTTYDRANIILTLKNYFLSELKKYLLPKNIISPINIEYIFYSNDNKIKSDLNNHALFYEKVFSDVIQEEIVLNKEQGKIKNEFSIISNDDLDNYTSYEVHHCYLPKQDKNHYLAITIYDSVDNNYLLNKLETHNLTAIM